MASLCNVESKSSCNDTQETVECFHHLDTAIGIYWITGIIVDIQMFDDGRFPKQDNLHALCATFLPE